MEVNKKWYDYANFDVESYYDIYFGNDTACLGLEGDQALLVEAIKTCNIKGRRLLEVGTGPAVCNIISLCSYFEEIYLSDYSQSSLRYLEEWLSGEKNCHRQLIEQAIKLDGATQTPEERENQVRQKVKGILPIDISKTRPLGFWNDVTEFDVIIATGCFSIVATSVEDFTVVTHNTATLLKSGGRMMVTGGIGGNTYKLGDSYYKSLLISSEEVKQAFINAGLKVQFYRERPLSAEDRKSYDYDAYFYIVAGKD